jgi:large subunit ribosomal protein L31
MKKQIHPTYYPQAKVSCACGNSFITGSTLPEIKVDICSACHPFFTGSQKLIDTQGRVERFIQQREKAKAYKMNKKTKKALKEEKPEPPKTLREMLKTIKK